MKTHSHAGESGFTLIEMVVVIGVIATILGSYLSFYKPTQTARSTVETKQKIERILNALSNYALLNQRLPCAARPNNEQSGIPLITGLEPTPVSACTGGGVDTGIIPYATLGLFQEDAKDGFANYMTYIVLRNATNVTITQADSTGSVFCSPGGGLTVRRNNVNEHDAYVVIISHGPDGVGGFNMAAATGAGRLNTLGSNLGDLGGSGDSGERGNAIDRNNSLIDINDTNIRPGGNHFDDIVGYMTGPAIISRLGVTYCR